MFFIKVISFACNSKQQPFLLVICVPCDWIFRKVFLSLVCKHWHRPAERKEWSHGSRIYLQGHEWSQGGRMIHGSTYKDMKSFISFSSKSANEAFLWKSGRGTFIINNVCVFHIMIQNKIFLYHINPFIFSLADFYFSRDYFSFLHLLKVVNVCLCIFSMQNELLLLKFSLSKKQKRNLHVVPTLFFHTLQGA